jgi:[acyl-carrier-protein] S-malonyltransferase
MKHAFVFPGQGSQTVGMLAELATVYPIVKQTFEQASDIVGYDLWQLSQIGPEEILNQTDKSQPALLAADVAVWRIWCERGGTQPSIMAGHSFGEYSALVCTEALTFTEGVQLAQDRGRFMQDAVPIGIGAVAALLGLEETKVLAICEQVAQDQVVSAVNFNAPNQIVIAGHTAAVERAIVEAKLAGAKRAVLLPISVPVHCSLMQPAVEKMARRLEQVTINIPKIPVLHNIDITVKTEAIAIRQALSAQIDHPVHWIKTIQTIAAEGITYIFECGPGKVLTGLNKRISKEIKSLPIFDQQTLEQALKIVEL